MIKNKAQAYVLLIKFLIVQQNLLFHPCGQHKFKKGRPLVPDTAPLEAPESPP